MAKHLNRRNFLGALAAGASVACSQPLPNAVKPNSDVDATGRLYIDGLSFLKGPEADIAKSGLHAAIIDASKVVETLYPDGSKGWLRTFESCDKGINAALASVNDTYETAFIADKGSEIGNTNGLACFLMFQSCNPIGTDLDRIGYFHDKGLRILQFTHHHNNGFAGGALEANQSGLTRLGRDGLAEMNRLKVIPDVSHSSVQTTLDVAAQTKTPFILSHGACRAIVDNPRCATDDMIRAVANSGGVMGIFMMSFWLTDDKVPTVQHYVENVKHLVKIGGIDSAAIANDFPMAGQENLRKIGNDNSRGVQQYHEWWQSINNRGVPGFETLPEHVVIPELNGIDRMQRIERALDADPFFTASDVDKIMGQNWHRVLTEVLG